MSPDTFKHASPGYYCHMVAEKRNIPGAHVTLNDDLALQIASITPAPNGGRAFTPKELAAKAVFIDKFTALERPAKMVDGRMTEARQTGLEAIEARVEETAGAIAQAELEEYWMKPGMPGFEDFLRGMQSRVMTAPDVVVNIMKLQDGLEPQPVGETYKALKAQARKQVPYMELEKPREKVEERLDDIKAVVDFASLRTDPPVEKTLLEAKAVFAGWIAFENRISEIAHGDAPRTVIVDPCVFAAREAIDEAMHSPKDSGNLWMDIRRSYDELSEDLRRLDFPSKKEISPRHKLKVFRQVLSDRLYQSLEYLDVPMKNLDVLNPALLDAAQEADRPKSGLERLKEWFTKRRRRKED